MGTKATGMNKSTRRLKAAKAIAALVQLGDDVEEVVEFDQLPKAERESAEALAREAINLVDALWSKAS